MNGAQLHLILNHLPVLGALFSLLLLSWGLIRRSPEILQVAIVAVLLAGLSAIPAYLTGESAEHVIEGMPGIEEALIEEHESMGKFALGSGIVLAIGAALALLMGLRNPKSLLIGALALCVLNALVFGVMGYTAHLGGMIRHPEIRGGAAAPTPNAEKPYREEEHD
ncbi:MAG: hypothetical protein KatS3mg019_2402 [Fimbriimonadales bacterium]|nr:MAG: hypothetical protein KatS3mg019_2402 [Fimbriimonadales bacterium]